MPIDEKCMKLQKKKKSVDDDNTEEERGQIDQIWNTIPLKVIYIYKNKVKWTWMRWIYSEFWLLDTLTQYFMLPGEGTKTR